MSLLIKVQSLDKMYSFVTFNDIAGRVLEKKDVRQYIKEILMLKEEIKLSIKEGNE